MSTDLIPADELSAFYDPKRKQLTLSAKGYVQPVTDNIHFVRQIYMGGLLFELVGTCYPVMGKKKPYSVDQPEYVSMTPFPKDVIVKTSNYPNGTPVPVFWGGLGSTISRVAPSSVEGKAPGIELPPPHVNTIYVPMGKPFDIKQDAIVPKGGSVHIDFDKKRLELIDAKIADTSIVWTFVGRELGQTQANVFVSGGIAQYVIRIPHNIDVIVWNEAESEEKETEKSEANVNGKSEPASVAA